MLDLHPESHVRLERAESHEGDDVRYVIDARAAFSALPCYEGPEIDA